MSKQDWVAARWVSYGITVFAILLWLVRGNHTDILLLLGGVAWWVWLIKVSISGG